MNEHYTVQEMALALKVHERTVRNLANANEIPGAIRIRRSWRFDAEAVRNWLKGKSQAEKT